MSSIVDFKKMLKPFYNPSQPGFHIVTVPRMNFLMIDGTGNPATSIEYQSAVEVLYSVAYGIKFALKPSGYDHVVAPLEGLWWMDDMNEFTMANKDRWKWTMMILQPEWVTTEWFDKVKETIYRKKKSDEIRNIRLMPYEEGLSVQILYTGAYVDEAPTIAEMHKFISENGYQPGGKHHEIYLGDPRKTTPEKLKTVLRQPMVKL